MLAGLEPAGGICGFINLIGEQLPPPKTKWEQVVIPKGGLRMPRHEALAYGIRRPGRGKWLDLVKGDLDVLAKYQFRHTIEARAVGPIIAGARVMVSARTDYNAFKAVAARMFRAVPPPEDGLWQWARTLRPVILPSWGCFPPALERLEWLQSMPRERQRPLGEACVEYDRTGWLPAYALFHAFIKVELLAFFAKGPYGILPLDSMVDRLINAPHDVTHVVAGRRIKPYMKWLKQQWNSRSFLFYASTGPEELQEWLDRATTRGPRTVFWSDYTLFDASHNSTTWDFIEEMYAPHFEDPDFRKVLECWRTPQGRVRGMRYHCGVVNASGRDDTALSNAMLNGFAMLASSAAAWYLVDLRDVTCAMLQDYKTVVQLAVCGDDALGFLPEMEEEPRCRFLTSLRANLARFGFTAKAFASNRFEDGVFLGHRPLPVDGRWYWSKTLGRCLYKLGWQTGTVGDGTAWMRGVMKMHQNCSRHTPVLSEIAETYMKATEGYRVTECKLDTNKPWEWMGKFGPDHYSEDTLEALAQAYTVTRNSCRQDLSPADTQVTRHDIEDLCRYVRRAVVAQPCVLDHWLLKHMVWVDEQ